MSGIYIKKKHPKTNADRIRGMTDEDLAEFLWNRDIQIVERASKALGFNYHYDEAQCTQNILDWIKSPGGGGVGWNLNLARFAEGKPR